MAVPTGMSVPSTIADAVSPGARVTTGGAIPVMIPPKYPFNVRSAWTEWRVEDEGPVAQVPKGGIDSQLVRRIPFAALDSLPDIVGWVASNSPTSMPTLAEAGLEVGMRTKRPGRRGTQTQTLP